MFIYIVTFHIDECGEWSRRVIMVTDNEEKVSTLTVKRACEFCPDPDTLKRELKNYGHFISVQVWDIELNMIVDNWRNTHIDWEKGGYCGLLDE